MMNKLTKVLTEWRSPIGWLNLAGEQGTRPAHTAHSSLALISKMRPARYLLPLLIAGLAVYCLAPQLTMLENAVGAIGVMSAGLVGLAGLAQVISYLGSGYLLKVIADLGKPHLSIVKGTLITLASASVGLVAGGSVGASLTTYRWIKKSEDTPEAAALAGVLPALYNNALLTIVAIVGLVYLWLTSQLSSAEEAGEVLFLVAFGLGLAALIYGLSHQALVERLAVGLVGSLMRLLHRPYDADLLRHKIGNVFRGLTLLHRRGWVQPVLGAAINIGFDMLTLYLLFVAAGHAADPGVLLAGYGLTFLLGKATFLFPGGIGVMESGMAAIYINLGIPSSVSMAVILGYRLYSFWIPTLLGFAAFGLLKRTSIPARGQLVAEHVPGRN